MKNLIWKPKKCINDRKMSSFTFAGCEGRGDITCPTCNADQEPGPYKENQMARCLDCYGRGLIAHRDGSCLLYTSDAADE